MSPKDADSSATADVNAQSAAKDVENTVNAIPVVIKAENATSPINFGTPAFKKPKHDTEVSAPIRLSESFYTGVPITLTPNNSKGADGASASTTAADPMNW